MTTEPSRRQPESTTWWTPRRTKLAGLGGVLGGIALAALATAPADAVIRSKAIGVAYSAANVLLLAALLAAHARYGTHYGRPGRYGAIALGLLLAGVAGFTLFFSISPLVFGIVLAPFGILYGLSFYGLPLAAGLYGYGLWRQTAASRIAAGSLLLTVPVALVLVALVALDRPVLQPQLPVYVAFAALGYDLVVGGESRGTGSG